MPESLKEFRRRRFHELEQSGEFDQLGDMPVTDFLDMLEREFYDCADDPAPPSAALDDRGSSLLQ